MTSKEALEKISWRYVNEPTFQEWCNTIKQDLERLEKLEKVLEIIKDKFFMEVKEYHNPKYDGGYLDYADWCHVDNGLTQEQYELFKEVL